MAEWAIDGVGLESMIEFSAAHFSELKFLHPAELCPELFAQIISHRAIRLVDEDSLYSVIAEYVASNPALSDLFAHVHFEFLSRPVFAEFLQWIEDNFDQMSPQIWKSVCRCFSRHWPQAHKIEQPDEAEVRPNGIIAHLTRTHGDKNVHLSEVVNVTSSSVAYADTPFEIVELTSDRLFHTGGTDLNPWVCYDFKDRRIRPVGYSLFPYPQYRLGEWLIEVSNDETSWTEIDRRNGANELVAGKPGLFSISSSSQPRDPCRFLRLRPVSRNPDTVHTSYLTTRWLEIYGTLFESDYE
jgi:hypothetical protein